MNPVIPDPDIRYDSTRIALVEYQDAPIAFEFVTDDGKRVGVAVDRATFFSFLIQAKAAEVNLRKTK